MCNAGYAEKDFSSAFQFLKEQEKNNWELPQLHDNKID